MLTEKEGSGKVFLLDISKLYGSSVPIYRDLDKDFCEQCAA